MTTQPTWTVTGRIWNPKTREHDISQSIDFHREIDATGFVNLNKDYIAGMVIDKNDAARLEEPFTGTPPNENGWTP